MSNYADAVARPPRTLTELEQKLLLKATGEHRDGFLEPLQVTYIARKYHVGKRNVLNEPEFTKRLAEVTQFHETKIRFRVIEEVPKTLAEVRRIMCETDIMIATYGSGVANGFLLPGGGLVIDTPGMREFHLWFADGGLDNAFPDVAALAVQCHFRACTHAGEKRCAVQAALADGSLPAQRFASFQKLRQELDSLSKERREHTYQMRRRHAGALRRLIAEGPDE